MRERESQLSSTEREAMTAGADLIFQGTMTDMQTGGRAKAVEDHPDISFVCTFSVQKVLKGTWDESAFPIAVHSPSLTFGRYLKPSRNKLYTHYLKTNPDRPGTFIWIGTEWSLISKPRSGKK